MTLKLYNTLKREKEEFKPLVEGQAKVYSCGPTVYGTAHIGNLRAYIFMDLVRRLLEFNNFKTTLVMNITDVGHLTDDADQGEDKMEKGAKREGKTVWEIAENYTKEFLEDIEKLNIKKPHVICKATDHIKEQIDMIKQIEKNGFTYKTSDGIYFDTSKLKDYGKLIPNFKPENLEAGKRVEMGEKKNATDFALWKFSGKEKRQMEWESPWGTGFPGWHIECTAMGCKYLGDVFDIHTGGIEHIPIHHTNEIAQAKGANNKDHVNYWMHCDHLLVDNNKMAKSIGNVVYLKDILKKGFEPEDFRYLTLTTHYKKNLNFTYKSLESARSARLNILNKVKQFIGLKEIENNEYLEKFKQAINDDINTSKALSVLQEVLNSNIEDEEKLFLVKKFDEVLGLNLTSFKTAKIPEEITILANKRLEAKKQKDFELADNLREQINSKGYKIKDTPHGFELEAL